MRQKKPIKKKELKPDINTNSTLGVDILGGVFQGFTFGSGSAVAHNLFRSKPEVQEDKQKCKYLLEIYNRVCSTNNIMNNEHIQKNCGELYKEMKDFC